MHVSNDSADNALVSVEVKRRSTDEHQVRLFDRRGTNDES